MNVCVRGSSLVCNVFHVFLDVPDNILGKRTKLLKKKIDKENKKIQVREARLFVNS